MTQAHTETSQNKPPLAQPPSDAPTYQMRGRPVTKKDDSEVMRIAERTVNVLQLDPVRILTRMDFVIEDLRKRQIEISMIEDAEWNEQLSDASYDPATGRILMPNALYERLTEKNPAHEDMHIFFHELGHFILGHNVQLFHHFKQENVCKEVDAEHQADLFAETVMNLLFNKPIQLTLPFDTF